MAGQCYKKCYSTRQAAKNDLKKLQKKGSAVTYVYWCDACSSYHLTSMPKQTRRRERNRQQKRKK